MAVDAFWWVRPVRLTCWKHRNTIAKEARARTVTRLSGTAGEEPAETQEVFTRMKSHHNDNAENLRWIMYPSRSSKPLHFWPTLQSVPMWHSISTFVVITWRHCPHIPLGIGIKYGRIQVINWWHFVHTRVTFQDPEWVWIRWARVICYRNQADDIPSEQSFSPKKLFKALLSDWNQQAVGYERKSCIRLTLLIL